MNKPVVATDVGGVADIVIDGVTGYLVKAGHYQDIAAKLIKLVEYPEIANLLVENGKKRIKERFQFNKRVEKIEELYRCVVT